MFKTRDLILKICQCQAHLEFSSFNLLNELINKLDLELKMLIKISCNCNIINKYIINIVFHGFINKIYLYFFNFSYLVKLYFIKEIILLLHVELFYFMKIIRVKTILTTSSNDSYKLIIF